MLYSLRGEKFPRYALITGQWNDGGSFYLLERRDMAGNARVVLCFSITMQGWLIGDARDPQTVRRAQALTKNWA